MAACSAAGCTNRHSKKMPGITFHRFPKDEEHKAAWVKALRRKDWAPSKYSRLCSEHFTEEMIDRTSTLLVRLRENAVPTIFKRIQIAKLRKLPKVRNIESGSSNTCEPHPSGTSEPHPLGPCDPHPSGPCKPHSSSTCEPHTTLKFSSITLCASTHCHVETRYKRKLHEFRIGYQKQIKILQQKNRRYRKRIENLTSILNGMRKRTITLPNNMKSLTLLLPT